MRNTFFRFPGLFLFLLILTGIIEANAQEERSALYAQTSEVNNIMVTYQADYGSLERFYFVHNSPERREELHSIVATYLKRLDSLPFESLNTGSRVDYILFRRDLREELHDLETEGNEYDLLRPWLPFADSIYSIERNRRRGTAPDAERLANELNNLGKELILDKKKLEEATISLPPVLCKRGESTVKGLQEALKNVFEFYNGYDPLFSWWIPQPYRKLDSLLSEYAGIFHAKSKSGSSQKDDGSGIAGNPIGREELLRRLDMQMIPYSPEELVDIANKEFAWCDKEMIRASHDMGFGDDWKAALEKVKNTYVPPGRQPEAIMKLYDESVDFLKKNDLLTIPPMAEETWRMIMMSPARQLVNPFFTGGEELSVSYPTNTMSQDDKLMSMRGNNPHFSRATVHHELIGGHLMQEYMTSRYKTYRHFETPFWIEGWALYWELLLWDKKFPQSPEDRIGMLFWRMHRCARIIFSLNYHLGRWTPQQCIDFLVDRVGHERANAEGEVRRSFVGGYDPLYQIAYMIGGLQFYALKKELVDSGKMTYKQYHDAVLRENEMPVEMVRAILTNQNLPKDFKTNWKFYK
jgi:uncharacterized protein DUF885